MQFMALDTETFHGKAFLLSCPSRIFHINSFLDFLKACQRLGKRFVFYNLEYDTSALCKHLPEHVVKLLYLEKTVIWENCKLRYLPGKYFKVVSPLGAFHFYDLFPFFQTSLNDASIKFLGKKKVDLPKSILRNLSPRIYKRHRALIDRYAIRDAKLLQDLCDIITGALAEIGLDIQHLYSPGYIAKRYLASEGVKVHDVPKIYRRFVERSRYGARIEITKRGYFPQVDVYDIKSAYPFALSNLPDLSKATYYYSKKIETKFYFVECQIRMKSADSYLIPFRFKDEKSDVIIFPQYRGQKAILTCFEYEYLIKNKLCDEIKIFRVLNIRIAKVQTFSRLVRKAFIKRKESPGKNILFKLILNSLYGIFAESIQEYKQVDAVRGYFQALKVYEANVMRAFIAVQARKCPNAYRYYLKECDCVHCQVTRYAMRNKRFTDKSLFSYQRSWYVKRAKSGRFRNVALASFVTAFIRVKIFDYQRRCGSKFIGCFTDSILTEPYRIKTKRILGGLEKKHSEEKLWMIGAGVYQIADEVKTRGFVWRKTLTGILRRNPRKRIYYIPQKARISSGIFVRRPLVQFDDFNEIISTNKRLNLNFDRKRIWARPFRNGADLLRKQIESRPISLDNIP